MTNESFDYKKVMDMLVESLNDLVEPVKIDLVGKSMFNLIDKSIASRLECNVD
ncbi:hypothetical protein AGMMS49953_09290 [Endomicrobiia bacterium]|nr:hypothetical protein AGMMS49953_09290 [Endomicrobiia bacterium]